MRLPKTCFALLAVSLCVPGLQAYADGEKPADAPAKPAANPPAKPAPAIATREEVDELRREVAELRAAIQRLLEAGGAHPATTSAVVGNAVQPRNPPTLATQPESVETVSEPVPFASLQAAQKKSEAPPLAAGWNGEHFYIKSADGQFQLQPYGYVQTDYRYYATGDGPPPNTFSVRRARFGFQGNYGKHFQFGILSETAAGSGAIIRDVYINVNIKPEFQVQAGQFKEPFAQELAAGVTNIDFVERGLQALLYPSAASAYRSPGFVVHGDISGGAVQYWGGVFNGKGFTTNNTTSVPETVGRVRFYPWRNHKDSALQGLAFGGSIAYSQTRGLSNEVTLNGTLPDSAYNFFPSFRVNGNVWRYEGEFTYLKGPFGTRGEYVQALYDRTGVGSEQLGGLAFANLPGVRFKAWNIAATYLLTGEKRPENGTPRVKRPLFGPETPGSTGKGWGAWEVTFRYSGIQGKEPGIFFNNLLTPQNVPGFDQHTDQFTAGVNWYINYWIRHQTTISVDRLKQPSTIGVVPQNYLVILERLQFRF